MSSSRAKDPYDRKDIPILLKAQGVRDNYSLLSYLIDFYVSVEECSVFENLLE